jgi:hypothetical protein
LELGVGARIGIDVRVSACLPASAENFVAQLRCGDVDRSQDGRDEATVG